MPDDDSETTAEVSGSGSCHELLGEWVKITGRPGVYMVVGANAAEGTADVLLISGIRLIERGIPLGSLYSLRSHQEAEQRSEANVQPVAS